MDFSRWVARGAASCNRTGVFGPSGRLVEIDGFADAIVLTNTHIGARGSGGLRRINQIFIEARRKRDAATPAPSTIAHDTVDLMRWKTRHNVGITADDAPQR
jgi:hypothetical protein